MIGSNPKTLFVEFVDNTHQCHKVLHLVITSERTRDLFYVDFIVLIQVNVQVNGPATPVPDLYCGIMIGGKADLTLHGLGLFFKDSINFLLAFSYKHRNTGFKNAGFLLGYFQGCVTKELHVVETDIGNNRKQGRDYIR